MRLLLFNLATDADDPVLGFTTAWLGELALHCDHIHVITVRQGGLDLPHNVSVYSVGKEKGYNKLRKVIEFYRYLGHILNSEQIDACFAHMQPLFAVLGAPLLKLKRIPITLWYTHKSVTWLLRLAEKLVDRVVTASPESFRITSEKVIAVGHGIDTDVFVPACHARSVDRPFTIISVGRLSPIKNVDILIQAVGILVQKHSCSDVQVRLVGEACDIDYAERLHHQVMTAGLEAFVHFVGPVPFGQVVTQYQLADVMVNLSDTGSVDKAVLEAMSCGVPVFTSNAAFERVLGDLAPQLVVTRQDAADLSNRLLALKSQALEERLALGQQLRCIVIRDHSLPRLAQLLTNDILPGNLTMCDGDAS